MANKNVPATIYSSTVLQKIGQVFCNSGEVEFAAGPKLMGGAAIPILALVPDVLFAMVLPNILPAGLVVLTTMIIAALKALEIVQS